MEISLIDRRWLPGPAWRAGRVLGGRCCPGHAGPPGASNISISRARIHDLAFFFFSSSFLNVLGFLSHDGFIWPLSSRSLSSSFSRLAYQRGFVGHRAAGTRRIKSSAQPAARHLAPWTHCSPARGRAWLVCLRPRLAGCSLLKMRHRKAGTDSGVTLSHRKLISSLR